MKENLAYLPVVHSNAEFSTQGTNSQPGYGVYEYNGSDVPTAKATVNYQTYGVLYNWYAAIISCPEDWHLPTDNEIKTLEIYLGMSQIEADKEYDLRGTTEGDKLKKAGLCGVRTPCGTSGFDLLLAGARDTDGSFYLALNIGFFWSSFVSSPSFAWLRDLSSSYSKVYRYDDSKAYGFSVRCLRD